MAQSPSPFKLINGNSLYSSPWHWKPSHPSHDGLLRLPSKDHIVLNPVYSFGTVSWRGMKPLTENTTAYWELHIDGELYGTSVMFGVGRIRNVIHSYDFVDFLGSDDNSYGLNHNGYAQRSGMSVRVTKPIRIENPRIGILFDGPSQSISYYLNDEYLCTPFVNIDVSENLYPMISSTAQHTSIRLARQYSRNSVFSLLNLTKRIVKESFKENFLEEILPRDLLTPPLTPTTN